MPAEAIHVVAAVIGDDTGRILLTQRPAGKHLAGLWEFPGGKCEPDEAPTAALRRELREEIGIDAGAVERVISVPWAYPEKSIVLDVYRVLDFTGVIHGRERQALRWADAKELRTIPMPPADRPVIAAMRLPRRYVITPEPGSDRPEFLRAAERVLQSGARLVQLRSKRLAPEHLHSLARETFLLTRRYGAQLLLNGHTELAEELSLDGVHLPSSELLRLNSRPLGADRWVGASCHNLLELAHAAAIGADFAVLGPVSASARHPDSAALGWGRFAELCAAAALPVYALGGMALNDLAHALEAGAQGIAGISAFWPD